MRVALSRALPSLRRSLRYAPKAPVRCLHRSYPAASHPAAKFHPSPVDGAEEISHAHFLASASPTSDFNPDQRPDAGVGSSHKGRLSPTTSHLFKLVLPLPKPNAEPQPTAFLLHPSQPLSHLSRLIAGSLPPESRDVEITYLALTGQESDLDTHLRNAEEEGERQEGGPFLQERTKEDGRWQEVSWSQSTDLADFIKQSCLNEKFTIEIAPTHGERMKLEVTIPSFESRTRFLRKRLLALTGELGHMTKQKKMIDVEAHKAARGLIVAGLIVGVGYWIAVVRYTFFTDAGWDVMEPVTWTVGFGGLLGSCAFLAYHNREVSYSSILDLSVTARQQALYEKHGLDIERWTEMVAEAKTLRKEIIRIASDYDIEWKGELETLADPKRQTKLSHDAKLDIDKTIDEADEIASVTEEQRDKEKAASRRGEAVDQKPVGKSKQSRVELGEQRAKELAKSNL